MSNLAQGAVTPQRLRKSGVTAKLWPNGEISFYTPKKMKLDPLCRKKSRVSTTVSRSWLRQLGISWEWFDAFLLGLSNVRNLDNVQTVRPRYGLKGITSLGRKCVRNGCHLLTRENGKHRLTFSTVTVPDLCREDMVILHDSWSKVIAFYRREMRRQLQRGQLSGEIVGVTEVQEERHEKSGFPVLHAHFVFAGMGRSGGWVISTARHDAIWRRAIQSVITGPLPPFAAACRLESVTKDVEGYLGKYMSKGVGAIAKLVEEGFEWALPAQWWNCSRSLSSRIRKKMRIFTTGVPWLIDMAAAGDPETWKFYSIFYLEMPDGCQVAMGSYGRLTPKSNSMVRKVLKL